MAGDLCRAFAVEHDVEGVGGLALPARRLARPQQLRAVIQRREYRGAGRRVREAQRDPLMRIAGFVAQRVERGPDLGAAVMENGARIVSNAAPVRHETGQDAPRAAKPLRVAVAVHRLLAARVAPPPAGAICLPPPATDQLEKP